VKLRSTNNIRIHSLNRCDSKLVKETKDSEMSRRDKLLVKILLGASDANISFEALCQLLESLGFEQRIQGSHHIFSREGVEEILNLQPKNGKAKAYQIKQVRNVILKYELGGQDED
jgi:hypothetical protein